MSAWALHEYKLPHSSCQHRIDRTQDSWSCFFCLFVRDTVISQEPHSSWIWSPKLWWVVQCRCVPIWCGLKPNTSGNGLDSLNFGMCMSQHGIIALLLWTSSPVIGEGWNTYMNVLYLTCQGKAGAYNHYYDSTVEMILDKGSDHINCCQSRWVSNQICLIHVMMPYNTNTKTGSQ
jgi:hypothetical protein